ncbi:MAG: DUF4148 domain-containing protein [Rubrivivax sp.]|nr:DUF4148 domain-containing protein [Rubrivivax sp.]
MNTNRLVSVLAFAAIGLGATSAALAQEATTDAWMAAASTQSRSAVQADLMKARADGSIRFARAGYVEPLRSVSSREQVRDTALAARRSGELSAIDAVVYNHVPQSPVMLARATR